MKKYFIIELTDFGGGVFLSSYKGRLSATLDSTLSKRFRSYEQARKFLFSKFRDDICCSIHEVLIS